MTDFECTKAKFAASLERLVSERGIDSKRSLIDDWIDVLSRSGIAAFDFSFSPRDLDDYYSDDEIVFSSTFYFYDPEYLRECCSPGDDCLAGKHCIPIGGVNGADEFIYVSDNLELGIAHLHRDDAFAAMDHIARGRALDLDAKVAATASRLKMPLPRFVGLLRPQTDLVKLFPRHDASQWLVVENLGTRVRYEIKLSGYGDHGEQSFDTASESERFFFNLIQNGAATTTLSILDCPAHLEKRIKQILTGSTSV